MEKTQLKKELNQLLTNAIKNGDTEAVKQLLKDKASPHKPDPGDGETPLTRACRLGQLETVLLLLKARVNVNRKDKYRFYTGTDISQTPLMAACDCDEKFHISAGKITRLLIKHHADVSASHPKGRNGALHLASKNGHVDAVSALLEQRVNVNLKGSYGYTALGWACSYGKSIELVKMLLEAGAKLYVNNKNSGLTLFRLISSDQDNTDIARLLIDRGVELKSEGYGDALFWAARCGKKKILELLLSIGADVNSQNYNKEKTAVFIAVENKYCDIAKLLLKNGADPYSKSVFDGDLLHQAVNLGDEELVKLILEKQNLLRSAQSNPQKKDEDINSFKTSKRNEGALVDAVKKGDLKIVKILIESGIDVNSRESDRNETALMRAAGNGKKDVLLYLIENDADIMAKDSRGNTALDYAASENKIEEIKILLEHGADIHSKNNLNWNALMQAAFKGQYSASEILLKAGSSVTEIDLEKGASVLWLAKYSGNAKLVQLLESYGAKERFIQERKPGEPFFLITNCGICAYLPDHAELTHDYSPEEIPGLEIIHQTCDVDYKAEETVLLKRCLHCGTYYSHYHYIDTEDSIGGAGPICSHRLSRCSLLTLPAYLRMLDKKSEAIELESRYPAIVESFIELCKSDYKFMPYIQSYVIHTLVEFFIMKDDWTSMNILLLNSKNTLLAIEAKKYLYMLNNAKYEISQPPAETELIYSEFLKKLRKMIKKYGSFIF